MRCSQHRRDWIQRNRNVLYFAHRPRRLACELTLLREAIFSLAISNTSCEVQGKNFIFAPRFERELALHFGKQQRKSAQIFAERSGACSALCAAKGGARIALNARSKPAFRTYGANLRRRYEKG
jgi:hypothetical protein